MLIVQGNLANTYDMLGRHEEALSMRHEVYSGHLNLNGEEHYTTLVAAANCAGSLGLLKRVKENKVLLRKTMPLARRVLGDSHRITLKMRWNYAEMLYTDPGATLDDLREAVTTLEETERTARRVLGGTHPITTGMEVPLRNARAALAARDGGVSAVRDAVEAMTPGRA